MIDSILYKIFYLGVNKNNAETFSKVYIAERKRLNELKFMHFDKKKVIGLIDKIQSVVNIKQKYLNNLNYLLSVDGNYKKDTDSNLDTEFLLYCHQLNGHSKHDNKQSQQTRKPSFYISSLDNTEKYYERGEIDFNYINKQFNNLSVNEQEKHQKLKWNLIAMKGQGDQIHKHEWEFDRTKDLLFKKNKREEKSIKMN